MTQANLVLYNAAVYTMDAARPVASGVALLGNRIVAVGDGEELRRALGSRGSALDLKGSTVVPGMIDAHLHFAGYGLRLEQVNLDGAATLEEALRRVSERVAVTEPGSWIRGGGWNRNLWTGGEFPTRQDLDRIDPHHPAALSSKDGHSTWINSRALEIAGITSATPDPPGGHIRRDPAGEPTGILQENAAGLIYDILPRPGLQEIIAACRQAQVNAHRVGLTGIHDCEGDQALAAFQELHRRGELTLRVLAHIPAGSLEAALALGLRDGLGDEWLRVAGVKLFADGALGSRSAWMLRPYEDEPANTGISTITSQALREVVLKANQAGLSVAVHAIGDAANRAVLDAIESLPDLEHIRLRNRIEHAQLLHPDDIARMAQLDVIASMQPIHATSDMEIADLHWGRRAATGYAWRSLLDRGARLAFGSDAPVEDPAPLLGIHAAVTRRRADGTPGHDGWYPEQRITVAEAVHAYTMGAAYASGEERIKGSLTPGKLADLVILDQDIFKVDPMAILDTQVLGTMVDGKFVYRSDGL